MIGAALWKVFWTITISIPTTCGTPPPDPYTGMSPAFVYAISCSESVDKHMEKEFETAEQALSFVKHGPKSVEFTIISGGTAYSVRGQGRED